MEKLGLFVAENMSIRVAAVLPLTVAPCFFTVLKKPQLDGVRVLLNSSIDEVNKSSVKRKARAARRNHSKGNYLSSWRPMRCNSPQPKACHVSVELVIIPFGERYCRSMGDVRDLPDLTAGALTQSPNPPIRNDVNQIKTSIHVSSIRIGPL